jgi:ABC-2 type transport system permease protein
MSVAAPRSGRLEAIARPRSVFQRNLNLVRELSITQFKLKYTGSALGYVWSLVKPAMLFSIMYLVFSVLLKAAGTGPGSKHFPVQLLLGIVIWTFFAEATSSAVNAIAGAGDLIRKAYFPRWILVVASTTSATLTFAINTVLVIVVTLALGQLDLTWRSLLAPLFYVELVVLILGLSLLLSALFVFFRDLGHIWEIVSLVLFYGSAVVFPFSRIPRQALRDIDGLNPIAQIIQDLRHALVDPGIPSMGALVDPAHPALGSMGLAGPLIALPILIALAIFAIGFGVFHWLTPKFAESL